MKDETKRYLGVLGGTLSGRLLNHYAISQIDVPKNRQIARGVLAAPAVLVGLAKAMEKTTIGEDISLMATAFGAEMAMDLLAGPEGIIFKKMYGPEEMMGPQQIYTKQIVNLRGQIAKLQSENGQLKAHLKSAQTQAMFPAEEIMPAAEKYAQISELHHTPAGTPSSAEIRAEMDFME